VEGRIRPRTPCCRMSSCDLPPSGRLSARLPKNTSAMGRPWFAIGDYSGTNKASGKPFKAPSAHVWKLREVPFVRFQQFTDAAVVQQAMR
jgi:uncharacterized protein